MFLDKSWRLPSVDELIKRDFFFNGKKEIIFFTNEWNKKNATVCKFVFTKELKTTVELIEVDRNFIANAIVIRNNNEFKQFQEVSLQDIYEKLNELNNPMLNLVTKLKLF